MTLYIYTRTVESQSTPFPPTPHDTFVQSGDQDSSALIPWTRSDCSQVGQTCMTTTVKYAVLDALQDKKEMDDRTFIGGHCSSLDYVYIGTSFILGRPCRAMISVPLYNLNMVNQWTTVDSECLLPPFSTVLPLITKETTVIQCPSDDQLAWSYLPLASGSHLLRPYYTGDRLLFTKTRCNAAATI